ncbi:DUF4861 family protein [Sphingomonas aracearum]|uniref:DUF4861 domain-containing protein n=1 Tax=Sphingomonas aracearum TaxID=2283317 RepID=A0A369VY63_9SPHN|nr:DUF4861 family protein [Sphingomonas aracearum]RDE07336.1 DUF4861 domain-containing protein [Sphingomonas aracearum]
MIPARTAVIRPLAGIVATGAALLVPGAGVSQQAAAPQMPAITRPLTPPADKTARAVVTFAGYRYGDLLWENDRTAHRVYGQPLEAHEPPSGSGVDAWGKSVNWPFADRQLKTGDQHGYHGEGVDFYNVGTGRGAGGLGIWSDNKLWVSRNYRSYKILASGGDVADFEVSYAPWPVDVTRKVWETRRFTLKLGSQFTRLVSTLSSDRKEPLVVGIGIGKRTTLADKDGQVTVDRTRGIITWWSPDTRDEGAMGIALRVDPAMIVGMRQDADNHLVLLQVRPDAPFVYYSGSVWSKGNSGIRDRAAWDRYVAAADLDFAPPPASARR